MRSLKSAGINAWQQRISVTQGSLADSDNTIGVQADAKSGWDNRYDNEKPPVVDSSVPSVRLTLDGTDAKGRAVALSDRMVPASVGTKVMEHDGNPGSRFRRRSDALVAELRSPAARRHAGARGCHDDREAGRDA